MKIMINSKIVILIVEKEMIIKTFNDHIIIPKPNVPYPVLVRDLR